MNEAQRQEWNAAVAEGDESKIARLQREIMDRLHLKEQDEVLREAGLR